MIKKEYTDFGVGDRVMVSSTATGLREDVPGEVTHVEFCLGHPIITVKYLRPTWARWGITLSNPGLITKIDSNV